MAHPNRSQHAQRRCLRCELLVFAGRIVSRMPCTNKAPPMDDLIERFKAAFIEHLPTYLVLGICVSLGTYVTLLTNSGLYSIYDPRAVKAAQAEPPKKSVPEKFKTDRQVERCLRDLDISRVRNRTETESLSADWKKCISDYEHANWLWINKHEAALANCSNYETVLKSSEARGRALDGSCQHPLP